MQTAMSNSIPILSETLHHSIFSFGLNESLFKATIVGSTPAINSNLLNNTIGISSNNPTFCPSLLAVDGELKGFRTITSGLSTHLQLHKSLFTLENQTDFMRSSLLSNSEALCTLPSASNRLPSLPTTAPLSVVPLSSSLSPLNQLITQPSSFLKEIVSSNDKSLANKHQKIVAVKAPKKKRNRQRCPIFLSFIKDWINQGFYFGTFCKCMEEVYLFKGLPKDEETYNEHETCRRVYLTKRGYGKYTLHYSLMSPNGKFIPCQYALSSLKKIFADVEKSLKG